ncbi:MAG: hypothetical protein CML66_29485 [Rhodobacteraceae bacterium]|nr:hypothetical protein [Paracoccaceae bacterium]MAY47723.1 hypothetical protein [Paracoccaceae bacterium]
MTPEHAQNAQRLSQFPAFSADPDAPDLDYETAALMRSWIQPLIDQASCWHSLNDALDRRGYGLAFRDGRLWLTRTDSGTHICTMRHLGSGMRELASRLGRPAVRPLPGRPSCGKLRV